MKKMIYAIIIMTLVLFGTNYVENMLVGYGLVNPVIGGLSLPLFTAVIVVLILWLLKKKAKVDTGL